MNSEKTADKSQDCPVARIKRHEGESIQDFRKERKDTNKMIRHFVKGMLFHDPSENGTYSVGRRAEKDARKEAKRQRIKRRKAERNNNEQHEKAEGK